MSRITTLTPEQMQEIKRLLVEQDQHVAKAVRQQLEWRFFLILLEAYCDARDWTIEYASAADGSVAIFSNE
jgi:hypothetical protein